MYETPTHTPKKNSLILPTYTKLLITFLQNRYFVGSLISFDIKRTSYFLKFKKCFFTVCAFIHVETLYYRFIIHTYDIILVYVGEVIKHLNVKT